MKPMEHLLERVKNLDLYLLLGVEANADEETIKKAYRKKALQWHPDKNPDKPNAAEMFRKIADALEVLTSVNAREIYDNAQKAKKAEEVTISEWLRPPMKRPSKRPTENICEFCKKHARPAKRKMWINRHFSYKICEDCFVNWSLNIANL